ncbi:fasciclin domain-containing protein [Pontibacter virosus]|nr:fasciclin domain-containing protein [Pontibacter virosus]
MLKPLAVVFAAGFLYSCASSNDAMDNTAMDETTTMSETTTMAGDDVTTETEVSTDVTTTTTDTDVNASATVGATAETSSMAILDAARTKSEISTFMELIQAANISKAFEQEGEFTIFAPTNEAFQQLPAGQLDYLKKPENRNELIQVLQAHIISGKVTTAQLETNQRIQVGQDDYIEVGTAGSNPNAFTIGGANIVESNIEANNGVIHVVDRVLVTADRVSDEQ